MPLIFDLFSELVVVSVSAYAYAVILTEPGMVLARWYEWIDSHLPEWLFKPIVGCFRCVTGQWALWWYLISQWENYNGFIHIGFVLCAIYISDLLNYLWQKVNN